MRMLLGSLPHCVRVVQKTRQKMRECGLPTPANCIIRRPEDLPGAAKQVQFPAMLTLS